MSHNKIFTVTCALAVALAPFNSEAATREAGLNACADALVTKISDDYGTDLGFHLDSESEISKIQLGNREVYHLDVRDPNTDKVVARAECIVDRKAHVRELVSVPLSADEAAVRARSF